jgi:hypothetical protein
MASFRPGGRVLVVRFAVNTTPIPLWVSAWAQSPPLEALPVAKSVTFPVVRFAEEELEALPEPQVLVVFETDRLPPT